MTLVIRPETPNLKKKTHKVQFSINHILKDEIKKEFQLYKRIFKK
jgi:hypothetical protein